MDYNSKKEIFYRVIVYTNIPRRFLFRRIFNKITGKYSKETCPAQLMEHLKPSKFL